MERSERGRSLEGGGRFDVRVEIEGSVCCVWWCGFWEVVSHGRRLVVSILKSVDLSPVTVRGGSVDTAQIPQWWSISW